MPEDPLDVEAVADLVQAIGNGIPVTEELVVARNAEVERFPDTTQRAVAVELSRVAGMRSEIERDVSFQIPECVAKLIQILLEVGVGLRAHRALFRYSLGARAQDIGSEDVELHRLVDSFPRILPEETVAPINDVVQIGHHRLEHIRGLPVAGDDVGAERCILPCPDAVDGVFLQLGIGAGREIDKDFLNPLDIGGLEWLHLPEPLGGGSVAVVGGIKNIVEPLLCFRETLVLAQVEGDGKRHVKEKFPVVHGVSAARCEVEVFYRVRGILGVGHEFGIWIIVLLGKDLLIQHRPRLAV